MIYEQRQGQILVGDSFDALRGMDSGIFDACVTSPPYFGMRDYGQNGQIGLEESPEAYIARLVAIFREVRRTLKEDGTLWINIGDTYAGGGRNAGNSKPHPKGYKGLGHMGDAVKGPKPGDCKPKDLIGIPWLLAFALRGDGWYLRQDIIWQKPNAMPESVRDRCTKSHEYILLLSKARRYYFDGKAIMEEALYDGRKATAMMGSKKYEKRGVVPGNSIQHLARAGHERWQWIGDKPMKNKRDVWSIPTQPYTGAHFAVFPPELVRPCIRAGSRRGGIILDPFIGSGTTALVAVQEGRRYVGIDINPDYAKIAHERMVTHEEAQLQAEH